MNKLYPFFYLHNTETLTMVLFFIFWEIKYAKTYVRHFAYYTMILKGKIPF